MNTKTHLLYLYFFVVLILPSYAQTAPVHDGGESNAACLRCHALPTLSVRDSVLGGIRNLSVSPDAFKHSIHHDLTCSECHTSGFTKWPHTADTGSNNELICINCHQDPELNLKSMFVEIQHEFAHSVHVKRLGGNFTCFACHDPHTFQRQKKVSNRKIESANATCIHCHGSEQQYSALTDHAFPNLETTHAWLPNQNLHWESVRCIDCHTSYEAPNMSHNILPKENAVTKCESCHSKNSVLLAKLYKYQHGESQQKMGFINGTLLNDAYVIGSTRNPILDVLSHVIFGLMVVSVVGHGYLRYRSKKIKKREQETEKDV